MVGVDPLDEVTDALPLAPFPAKSAVRGEGSREIVFLRPLLVVPGTLGPVEDEVYLMISVSIGKRRESSMELLCQEMIVIKRSGRIQ